MAKTEKKLIGKVPPEAVRMLDIPRLPQSVVDGFSKLTDLTGTVSDAMDKLGLVGAIPASVLIPTLPAKRVVGPAITVRNVERKDQIFRAAQEGDNMMGETEAYNLAESGDVIVIEGLTGASNMGGQSATIAQRQGCAGAVIDGSFRDPDASRDSGFPIWARGVTQITGKWRLQTVEINGPVQIAGIQVRPGDLVTADEAGICFVPREHANEVLEQARKIDAGDDKRKQDIARGVDVKDLVTRKYK
jgi:regulator of RNase E activity RraA